MKKFKYHQSGTGKASDRYFSKIRSRKIEKCLSQLQDALRKNDGLVTGSSRTIDVAVFMDKTSSNNCYNTNNMQQNIYPKYTESYFQKQDGGTFEQQINPIISNQDMELAWSDHTRYDLQVNNSLEEEEEETKGKHFTTTNLELSDKTSDPRLCMLFVQSNWGESCDASSAHFVCESKGTHQEQEDHLQQQHVDDDRQLILQNEESKRIEWHYSDLVLNTTSTEIYDLRKKNDNFNDNINYEEHLIYASPIEEIQTGGIINIQTVYPITQADIFEDQPSNDCSE